MRTAWTVLASVAAINILIFPALAQQDITGMVTMIDRLNGTIAIQKMQDATVGANPSGPIEQYKVQDGKLLDTVHAGDRVAFSTTGNGVKTITKLQKQ
jgi:hypothetical protein